MPGVNPYQESVVRELWVCLGRTGQGLQPPPAESTSTSVASFTLALNSKDGVCVWCCQGIPGLLLAGSLPGLFVVFRFLMGNLGASLPWSWAPKLSLDCCENVDVNTVCESWCNIQRLVVIVSLTAVVVVLLVWGPIWTEVIFLKEKLETLIQGYREGGGGGKPNWTEGELEGAMGRACLDSSWPASPSPFDVHTHCACCFPSTYVRGSDEAYSRSSAFEQSSPGLRLPPLLLSLSLRLYCPIFFSLHGSGPPLHSKGDCTFHQMQTWKTQMSHTWMLWLMPGTRWLATSS